MHSGQTRAILMREGRAGKTAEILLRKKRMGDLAWQMSLAEQKISACPREKRTAKEALQKLFNEAKAEYNLLKFEIDLEKAPENFGVYIG